MDGWVIPTGLTAGDSYDTVRTKADGIITGFQQQLGANTVRLPINPQSVNSDWWSRYKGAADSALAHGMKVIFGYWEANKDGLVDDVAAWNTMWDKVTADYGGNGNVYFEPMNEPFGYSLNGWVSLCSTWLSRHSNIPRSRVADQRHRLQRQRDGRRRGERVERHAPVAAFLRLLGVGHHSRGMDHQPGQPARFVLLPHHRRRGRRPDDDRTGLLRRAPGRQRLHRVLRRHHRPGEVRQIGVVYWPGLRSGDTYSITRQSGGGLAVNNASGVAQLRWGWGL